MKPIAVFRFSRTEGPGHFGTWLARNHLPCEIVAIDRGEAVPRDPGDFSGIAMMGGPMSVNDPLPWISPLLEFVRTAAARDVPVLGHCLGGQLLAKAMGAEVTRTAVPEIGWSEVSVPDAARAWFGGRAAFTTFQWHYDVFTLPPSAERILTNGFNPNQGYVVGRNLGFQCHIEMTEDMVNAWCASGADELDPTRGPAIQSEAMIREALSTRLARLSSVADDVYARWIQGIGAR